MGSTRKHNLKKPSTALYSINQYLTKLGLHTNCSQHRPVVVLSVDIWNLARIPQHIQHRPWNLYFVKWPKCFLEISKF